MARPPDGQDAAGSADGSADPPPWKPVMTRAESDAWAAESTFQRTVYHATTVEAADAIRRHGFDLGRRAGGRQWGDGVYGALDEPTLAHYSRQLGSRGVVLELRLNVRRVLPVRTPPSSQQTPFRYVLALIPGGLGRFVDAGLRSPDRSAAFTQVVAEAGYDALEIFEDRFTFKVGGNQIVVFDPRRVVVIADDDAG